MQRFWFGLFVTTVVLGGATGARADEASDKTMALLNKAIKAAGGEENLTKLQGFVLKVKGTGFEDGKESVKFSGTRWTQGKDKSRADIEVEQDGEKTRALRVINGDKAWSKTADEDPEPLLDDELDQERADLYLNWVTSLAPLKSKEYKLTMLDESKIDDKPAVGLNVSAKDKGDIKLYFDKQSGLLVKTERKVKDTENAKEVSEEILLKDYKQVSGIQVALKYTIKWDGKMQEKGEITEAKVVEKLDDKLFTKPE